MYDDSGQDFDFDGSLRAQQPPLKNTILLSVPSQELALLRPHLQPFPLKPRAILHEPSQHLSFFTFPNSGLISLLVATEDGKTVEAGMLGNEGFAGVPSIVGFSRCPLRQVVQIGGTAFRIKVHSLHRLLPSAPRLHTALLRYAILQSIQLAQIAACNRLHDAIQRLSRWLLMAASRSGPTIPMTHEFFAATLGTDRPSISLAAKTLQRKKIIAYKRGVVTILNPKKLSSLACECHRAIEQFPDGLHPK